MAKICKNCGYSAKDTDQFCFQCGQPLEDKTEQNTDQTAYETQNNNAENVDKPLSVKDYLIVFLIMLIPIANIIMLLIWAFEKLCTCWIDLYDYMVCIGYPIGNCNFYKPGNLWRALDRPNTV